MRLKFVLTVCIVSGAVAFAQSTPAQNTPAQTKAPVPARKAVAAESSRVDDVIQLLKGGMSESLIIKTLQRQNKPENLSPASMLKLQKAGASDNIIGALMDPATASTAPTASATPATAAATVPVSVAPKPAVYSGSAECPAPSAVAPVSGSQKRRVAVDAFDYSAVQTQVTALFNNNVNIGQGIRAMMTAKMAQSKSVVLLEREKLKKVMGEQDMGATNRVKQGSKAKIGGLTGADAMLFGDIVTFGRDDTGKQKATVGGGRLPGIWGAVGGLGNAKKTDKAVVAINLRLVDAETGEVIDAAEARGESSRTSTNWGAFAGTWTGAAAASSSMTSSNFDSTIIGEATNDAVTKIVAFLETKVPSIGAKARTIEGRVAAIDGCTLYLSVGGNDGVHVGDHFEIHQIVKEVLDPQTKEVIDQQTVKVGDFIVSIVRDKSAIGTYGGRPLSPDLLAKPGYAARFATPGA